MSLQVANHQTEGYQISTSDYAGPLDLLLDLIEHSQLDITRLALAQVTDQYLDYLHNLTNRNAAEVSAFLVIAARLVQIKSAALLPPIPIPADAIEKEDPGELLAKMLILYRRFKQLAQWLDQRGEAGLHTYIRLSIPITRPESKLDLSGVSLRDLILAGRDILFQNSFLPSLNKVVNLPRLTIRERIYSIIGILKESGAVSFHQIMGTGNRLDVIVTFLALLELIKRQVVEVQQNSLFDDFLVKPIGEWDDSQEEPLEFKE